MKGAQQEGRGDAVEELLDVTAEDPLAPCGERRVDGQQGVAGGAPPSPGEGRWVEGGVEVGRERGGERVLHDAVANAREGEHPVAAARFGDTKLASGPGAVLLGEKLVPEAGEFVVGVTAEVLNRDTIAARTGEVGADVIERRTERGERRDVVERSHGIPSRWP